MAYTQSDLDALQSAMARGARRLKMDGEEVEFRSLDEMMRLESRIKQDLGQANASRVIRPQTSTGWR
ncbi:phage head-tail joining protein [Shimia aestuarii]|uniref:phage head-tail joining protein n=1 Tax=Shimia aestuarii TaxID=254406 RepID=UPI001FB2CF57|nr:hypothetical protein [Shimia aestuarii]